MLEKQKREASGALHNELADALHWPLQWFCDLWVYETTVTVATMYGWTVQ